MKTLRDYWTVLSIRGALMLIVAAGMATIGWFASTLMSIPFGPALALDVLAAYLLLDCGALLLQEFTLPRTAGGFTALGLRIAGSLGIGGILIAVVAERIGMGALPLIMTAQAGMAAAAEWKLARRTRQEAHGAANYATAAALTASALLMPLLGLLDEGALPFALAGYVALQGAVQVALGSRMLFAEYRFDHPAAVQSVAWQGLMDLSVPAAQAACGGCESCPAGAYCRDYTTAGQLAKVKASRVAAVVRSVRTMEVLEAAARLAALAAVGSELPGPAPHRAMQGS